MANEQNLIPAKKGEVRNPKGKPKGTKHLSTWIKELLNDDEFEAWILDAKEGVKQYKGAPMKAIVKAMAIRAINGDVKAFDALAKYGYGTKIDITSKGDKIIPILGGSSVHRNFSDEEAQDATETD